MSFPSALPAALAAASLALLAACGDAGDRSAAADSTRQAVKEARQEAREATAATRATPRNAAEPRDASSTATMGAAPAANPEGDAQVTARIQRELAKDQQLRGAKIDVDTQDGVVTLSGSVTSAAARARAAEIAHGGQGVKSVNDQLTLSGG